MSYNQTRMENKDPLATTALPAGNPRKVDEADTNENPPVTNDQSAATKYMILVVDDAADNVAMLSLDLQHQGYRVVTATNGEEAIVVASAIQPNLILMDISMPQLDGLGATRRIREIDTLKNIPIIAVTAFGTEGFRRAAYDVGVSGFLTKPMDFDRMHQLIARLLDPGNSGKLFGP